MIIPATAASGPVFVSPLFSYSLEYDSFYVMDGDNLMTALSTQIQVSIVLIGTDRKPSIEPIGMAKQWGITLQNAQETIQNTTQRVTKTMFYPSISR